MAATISASAPNSIILISGGMGIVPDQFASGDLITATPTMIAVGTLSELDGPTHITLVEQGEVPVDMKCLFVGSLHGIAGKLLVETCLGDVLLEAQPTTSILTIKVFANDSSEPDKILIVYSTSS